MRYCGIVAGPQFQHLCTLEEVRAPEPPVRLRAAFFEPGTVDEVLDALRALEEVVVAVGAPQCPPPDDDAMRACDAELLRRGVTPLPFGETGAALFEGLADLGIYTPPAAAGAQAAAAPELGNGAGTGAEPAAGAEFDSTAEQEAASGLDALGEDPGQGAGPPVALEGVVEDGAFRTAAVFEVNVDGVFCALQGRRVPAKRHPLGILRRIQELLDDQVQDEGGELWHRRIEEIEAAAAALAAHRYAVGHACWLGDPAEAVIVLPGTRAPAVFSAEGVIPAVPREPLTLE